MRLAAFTDSGYFWLPDDEDQSCQVAGTLAVSEAGRVTLETFGYLSDDPLSLAYGLFGQADSKLTRIFGYTRERGAVTLVDGIRTQSRHQTAASGVLFTSSTILVGILLAGGHFDDREPLFDRLTCKIEGLDEWLGISGITAEHDFESHRTSITYQMPSPLPFQASDDVEGQFGFGYSIPSPAPWATKAQVSQSAYIKLSTSTSLTTEDMIHWATRMRDFLSLGTDAPVAITSLEGYLPVNDQESATTSNRENSVRIFFQSAQHRPEPATVQLWSMNFAYRDLGDRLSSALTNWFDLCRKWPQSVGLFFGARYGDGILPGDLQFLKVVEAIETLAPAKGIGKNAKLHKKVRRLAEPFAELMGIKGGETEFAERVRSTRHWYVHHDDHWKDQASEGSDLFRLLWQCEVLLICHLTAFVLGDEAAAIQVLQDTESIKRRLRWA